MFYITVSNGLLSQDHRKKMGSAVWEFMWCLDKITRVDSKKIGYVLGGKPIKLQEIADSLGTDHETVSRNLIRLEEEGYIEKTRTMYGIVVKVLRAKKRFNKNVESTKVGIHKNDESNPKNVESHQENVESNKTVSVDITVDINKQVVEIIKSFTEINKDCSNFYKNTSQRNACKQLIENYTFKKVIAVIEKTLPKTNAIPYFPTITTPTQLLQKWSNLEAQIIKSKHKAELNKKGPVLL